MKRILIALALLLAFAGQAQAGPKKVLRWIESHKRSGLILLADAGASYLQWHATTLCQLGDLEKCTEGYGSRRAFNGFMMGADLGLFAAAEGCWKQNPGWKFCYALAYMAPATQAGVGVHDLSVHNPCIEYQPCGGKPPAEDLWSRTRR